MPLIPEELRIAQAKTILLFEVFLVVQVTPPVHSKTGLPKAESCMGYAALYDELREHGLVAGPTATYVVVAAEDAGLPLAIAEQAFIEHYYEPANPAQALLAKTGAKLLLADMRRRGFIPGVPLRTDGLPDPKWQMAYAGLHQALQQAND